MPSVLEANTLTSAVLLTRSRKCELTNDSLFSWSNLSYSQLDSILLPKVESAFQIQFVTSFLENNYGARARHIKYLATIESARGLVNLKEICQADPRLDALIVFPLLSLFSLFCFLKIKSLN
jgi:citrate lyase subunit beta-like protein